MQTVFSTGYGFNVLKINNLHRVYTCKIAVKNSKFPDIAGLHVCPTKSGKLLLSYVTTDIKEHVRMQKDIMLFLEEHAMSKIKSKYAWLHSEEEYKLSPEEIQEIELAL